MNNQFPPSSPIAGASTVDANDDPFFQPSADHSPSAVRFFQKRSTAAGQLNSAHHKDHEYPTPNPSSTLGRSSSPVKATLAHVTPEKDTEKKTETEFRTGFHKTRVHIQLDPRDPARLAIGRKKAVCDVVLPRMKNISRQHAFISYRADTGQVKLECYGTNGLIVVFPMRLDFNLVRRVDAHSLYELVRNSPDYSPADKQLIKDHSFTSFVLLKGESVIMPYIADTVIDFRQAEAVLSLRNVMSSEADDEDGLNATETEDELEQIQFNSDDFNATMLTPQRNILKLVPESKSPATIEIKRTSLPGKVVTSLEQVGEESKAPLPAIVTKFKEEDEPVTTDTKATKSEFSDIARVVSLSREELQSAAAAVANASSGKEKSSLIENVNPKPLILDSADKVKIQKPDIIVVEPTKNSAPAELAGPEVSEDAISSNKKLNVSEKKPFSSTVTPQTSFAVITPATPHKPVKKHTPPLEDIKTPVNSKKELSRRRKLTTPSPHKNHKKKTQHKAPTKPRQQILTEIASKGIDLVEIQHVLANHLAFSNIQQVPLALLKDVNSTISTLSTAELRALLAEEKCIGVIYREGKDAAGKPLDEEYYYDLENDPDANRRQIVTTLKGGRSGLRSCRRVHKQYFWKKPAK